MRTPFAAIYTSLGCKFKCDFCMINIVNRMDNADGVVSANSPNMRFWSPQFMLKEFEKLAALGAKTIRVSDEMFFLNKNYFEPLVDGLAERDLGLRMWTYSRVDTVRPQYLEKFRKAGINWLALGVEAGNQTVRREVSKGSFQDVNIREVIKTVRASGLYVISNYIFGFPDDTHRNDAADARSRPRTQHRDGQHVSVPGAARQPAVLYRQGQWLEAAFVTRAATRFSLTTASHCPRSISPPRRF